MKKADNAMYDMLFLVPSSLVETNEGQHEFKMTKAFENRDILLWDGTKEDNRLAFPVDLDEARVLQYESARGLEGWTVCCMNFDEFMQIKESQYNPSVETSALYLENAKDKKNKYLLNWALIPLTRAIDTLIITLKDQQSYYSKLLIQLAEQHPDYVRIIKN